MTVTVFGPAYSTYVRTARLALEEKEVAYDLEEVDTLKGEHQEMPHRGRNPFGPVPAFEHDGFAHYETDAIVHYVDRIGAGPTLTPADPKTEARMNQVIGIIDSFAYRPLVWDLVVERTIKPMLGDGTDEAKIADALPRCSLCLGEIDRINGGDPYLVGAELSLADLFLAPIMAYVVQTPEATDLLAPHPGLRHWWEAISTRPSMARTAPSTD